MESCRQKISNISQFFRAAKRGRVALLDQQLEAAVGQLQRGSEREAQLVSDVDES